MKINMERFAEAKDIKAELIAATAKAIKKIRIPRNRVLVASYVASVITPGGIYKPQKTLDEDRYQGKCGLVLAMGPAAFKFEEDPHGKLAPKIGQWVLYRPADSWEVGVGEGAPCRVIYDDQIVMYDVNPEDFY